MCECLESSRGERNTSLVKHMERSIMMGSPIRCCSRPWSGRGRPWPPCRTFELSVVYVCILSYRDTRRHFHEFRRRWGVI